MMNRLVKSFWMPLALMVVAFMSTTLMLPRLQLGGGEAPDIIRIPALQSPGPGAFFASDGREELSHIVLYHDIGQSIEHARLADILFIGNSRQQLGFREEVIAREAAKLGLKAFTIAVGHADKTRFALELIRRHDLRPKIVVASGGPFVFTEGLSPWAREVMGMNRWDARKRVWERTGAWAVKSRLHRVLPRLNYFTNAGRYGWVHYRSERTGWWHNVVEPPGRLPVSTREERDSFAFTLPLARELKAELDARGALLVLTMVPYQGMRSGHLPFLADALKVPYVRPSLDGLYTADGSHLDRASSLRFSREFWRAFIREAEVRNRLSLE